MQQQDAIAPVSSRYFHQLPEDEPEDEPGLGPGTKFEVGAGARVMPTVVVEEVPSCAVTANTAVALLPGVSVPLGCAVFDVYVAPFAVMVAAVE